MTSLLEQLPASPNILVMGATSGIGLAFANQLASSNENGLLFAVARGASRSASLAALIEQAPHRIIPVDADITCETQLAALAGDVMEHTNALHLVLNTAGLLHDAGLQPEKSISRVTLDGLMKVFSVNAFGPALLAKALLPLMRHGQTAIFASLSARVGSIGDNRLGGWYGYRSAKAAQNQLLRTFAVELTRFNQASIVLALHPGTTDTPLSQPFQGNVTPEKLFTADYAATCLLEVIAQRTPADSGNFFAWDGQPIPW